MSINTTDANSTGLLSEPSITEPEILPVMLGPPCGAGGIPSGRWAFKYTEKELKKEKRSTLNFIMQFVF
jgi:hypothetical protein